MIFAGFCVCCCGGYMVCLVACGCVLVSLGYNRFVCGLLGVLFVFCICVCYV